MAERRNIFSARLAASVLLLAALVGAIVLVREDEAA